MYKNRKRIIAILCMVCLLVTGIWRGDSHNAVEASGREAASTSAETITEENIPEEFKWVTASDFHSGGVPLVNTFSSADSIYTHDADSTLDKTVFTGRIKFSDSGENRIYFGGGWKGVYLIGSNGKVQLCRAADGSMIREYDPAEAGCQLTNNEDLKVTVSFEFRNNNGTNTDMKIGVFFNGNLYKNEYTMADGFEVANVKQCIHIYVAGSSMVIADAATRIPTYLDEYTTKSVGLTYGTNNVRTDKIGRDTVNGGFFGVRVKFGKGSDWLQYGGNGSSWYGLRFQLSGDDLYVGGSNGEFKDASGVNTSVTFVPAVALGEGYTTFNGTEFDLHISTEVVNHGGGEALDVRYGFFFNGKLYNDMYYYSYDTAELLGSWVGFQNSTPQFAPVGAISGKAVRTDLEQLTTDDIVATAIGAGGAVGSNYMYALDPANGRKGVYQAAKTFAGKTFGLHITLTGNTWFHFGGSGEWDGLRFKLNGNDLIIEEGGISGTTVTPDFIGESTFAGTPITIWISTEVGSYDGGDTEDDVKYSVYLDGKIYNTFYVFDYASNLSNGIVFQQWTSGSTFSPVKKTTAPICLPADKERVTFSDWNIKNQLYEGSANAVMGSYQGDETEILNTVFEGYVNFSSTRSAVGETPRKWAGLYFLGAEGSADSLYGMRLANEYEWITVPEGCLALSFWDSGKPLWLSSELAGVDLLDNQYKLAIEMIPADFDGDGESTDALVGIYINGVLYNNTCFKVAGALESEAFGYNTRIYTANSSLYAASVADETLPEGMLTLTADEMGIAGQWNCNGNSGVAYGSLSSNYTTASSTGEAMSLVGKILDMDIAYTGENYIHFAAANQGTWEGVRVKTLDGSVTIESSLSGVGACESVTCTPEIAGVDFTEAFNFKLSFAPVDGTNDVRVGVWFNDKLYNHTYLLWQNVADKLTASANIIPFNREGSASASITIADPVRTVPTEADGYTCKTIKDYGFTVDQVYSGNSEARSIAGLNPEKLAVSGKVALTGDGHLVLVGNWLGYYLGVDWTTNSVYLVHSNGIFGTKITAPLTDVANGQFAFDLVQTYVDADSDGQKDDVQIELWIDGKLAGGRSHYYMDYANKIGDQGSADTMRVFPANGTVVVADKLYYEYKDGYYFNLAHGDYMVMAPMADMNNPEAVYTAGDKIDVPGDYRITRADEASTVTNEVYLFKTGDANSDNQIDIRDLVAAKKAEAGVATIKSGIKAADVDNDGEADADILRSYLVGKIDNLNALAVNTVYYSLAEDGTPVMPIGGFWGPRTLESYTDATELNMIQEKYYKLIADVGINVINYIEVNSAAGDGSLQQNLQNLSLAEKYKIGMFILDSEVNGTLTEAQLAKRLSLYGKYGSFLGIHTYDEPRSDSFGNATAKTIAELAQEATKLNSYTNLSSYINLYPLTDTNEARSYLREYLSTCAPKYLTYDYYPTFTAIYNTGYFSALKVAREAGIPFWAYVSAGSNFTTDAGVTDDSMPSRSQLLWNVNTALAYGAKGIQYFPMIQPNYYSVESRDAAGNITAQDFNRNGLIAANGNTTKWYDYAKAANGWIGVVDGILMNADSKAVITCGAPAQYSTGITANTYNGTKVSGGSAIVGVFDYLGKRAYYVVNYNTKSTDDAVVANDITLTFDKEQSVTVYNSKNSDQAQASKMNTTNKALTVAVEYGGAALIIVE